MSFHEFFKEDSVVSGFGDNKGQYVVFDVRTNTVTLVPIIECVERGALKRKCDFSRKPILIEKKNFICPEKVGAK